ncbi:FecR family protein [Carboxylicivirga linearis]|uniref:DUF4974 domain-containing protein n=1 Tax=Carboxylicivirga linearis TaxID=1628157 RepID=A0ABS5JWU8_9BACT|nr:FecR domain-containing protein [Carboxylicivirga linearis]MBS2099381.1 DUF4974 domain-containing protein [Carboxylicivirga linearis]
MTKFKNKKILEKYVSGQTTSTQDKVIQSWLVENSEDSDVRSYFKNDWNNFLSTFSKNEEKKLIHILNKVHHTIRTNEEKQKERLSKRFIKWYYRAAAILFIPLLLGTFSYFGITSYFFSSNEDSTVQVICPLGSKMAFALPDGTTGMLNSDSYIEYAMPFNKRARNVNISGEVYFNVFHDKQRPFTVHSTQSEITVLGTSFNVRAYEDEATEIVLVNGKISCIPFNSAKEIILKPNEKLVIKKDKITRLSINAASYTSWKEGILIFRGESMKESLNKLSRWYNIDIEVTDDEIWTYSFTGTFINDSLDEVLKLLKLTSPMNYKIIPRTQKTDGSWTKQKVLLSSSTTH